MKKISEFLSGLDSHSAYDALKLEKDIEEITGRKFKFPKFSAGNMRTCVGREFKGPEFVDENIPDHLQLTSAWDVATIVAYELLGTDPGSHLFGRGSRFRVCVEALKKAGL